jgi:4a-hydroxytetrahydrobiopterin dehydratase
VQARRLERGEGTSAPHVRIQGFHAGISVMKRVALVADRMDHHPDWSNAYNKVTVNLSTHSAGGLTKNDFELAGKIQTIYDQ